MRLQDIHTGIADGSLSAEYITESNFQDIIVALLEYGHMSEFFDMTSAGEYPYAAILDTNKKRLTGLEKKIHFLYNERARKNAFQGESSK